MTQTRVELHHGDCLNVMPTLVAGGVDMVFCDLPYKITACKWDVPVDLTTLWRQLARILKPDAIAVFSSSMLFTQEILRASTMKYKYDLVYEKSRATGFLSAKKMPLRAHEHLLIFGRGKTTYTPQMVAVDDPRRGANQKKGNNGRVYGGLLHGRTYEWTDKRYPRSITTHRMPREEQGLHPTQKPLGLLEWILKSYSLNGHVILDPTMGSGVTGVACKRLGRHFIGIEKDEKYFNAAKKRIDAESWPTTL